MSRRGFIKLHEWQMRHKLAAALQEIYGPLVKDVFFCDLTLNPIFAPKTGLEEARA